ncbi:MAG TPA: phosphopantetheine-binding protein [Opitutaceae bacterium]|nr:phosphopantetheine-binding protein [Opitutaceae bacterium]
MKSDEILQRLTKVVHSTVPSGNVTLTRETRAMDVRGWDSLSHTMIIVGLEDEFGLTFPTERVLAVNNVGQLMDLIAELSLPKRPSA